MKRTISILVIVAMMLASLLAIVPVSAVDAEATPIKNAREFAAMDASGNYYLANDITISAPYGEFKGVLDGNGHTITVRGPMAFTKLTAATVSNLTVVASAAAEAPSAHVGALAATANGVFTNVHAVVDYNYTGAVPTKVAGLIGELNGATIIDGCTAKGSINMPFENSSNSETAAVGGLVAYLHGQTVSISKCVNYVSILNMAERTNVGGILGQANGTYTVTIDSCANYGVMTSTCSGNGGNVHSGVAGIVGQLSGNANANNGDKVPKDSKAVITNSRNYADINVIGGNLAGNKDKMAGGILGRIYGSNDVTVSGCVNSGNIESAATGWGSSGGIIGQAETYNFGWSANPDATIVLDKNINLGKVNGNNCAGIFGSTAQIASPGIKITLSNCINYGEVDADSDGNGAGMFGSTCDVANGTYTFINCYNAGKVDGAGIVAKLSQAASSGTYNEALGKTFGLVSIEGCINVGEVTTGGLVGGYTGPALAIKASASTFEGDVALAPEGDSVKVTETPEDAAAAAAALLATLPAVPTEIDVVIAENKDNEAADYSEGWDVFKAAFDKAFAVAIKSSTIEEMEAAKTELIASLDSLVINDELDFLDLDIALDEADEFIGFEEDYLPYTWEVFQAAFEAANACAEAERQSQINKAAAALINAINGLELKPDYEALDEALALYVDLVEAEYTTTSWAAFKAARDVAEALKTDEMATGGLVNDAIAALKAAAKGLGKKVDPAPLKAKYDEVLAQYKMDDYTSDSYYTLNQLLIAANDYVKNNDVSQAEMDTLLADIDVAIAGLLKRADLTELKALVDICKEFLPENYSEEAWAAFEPVFDKAADAVKPGKDSKVTIEQGAALLAELQAAVAALGGVADFTAIDALIAEVGALTEADYTAETWKALQDAIAAANALKEDPTTTAEAAAAALVTLQAAKDALAKAEVPTEKPTEQPTEQPTEPAKEDGCGGSIALGATVVVAILGTAIVLKKKED